MMGGRKVERAKEKREEGEGATNKKGRQNRVGKSRWQREIE